MRGYVNWSSFLMGAGFMTLWFAGLVYGIYLGIKRKLKKGDE